VVAQLKQLACPRKPQFFSDLVKRYAADSEKYLNKLHVAIQESDSEALGEQAHALKGSSRTVGAVRVGEICAELEAIGKGGTVEGAAALMPELESNLIRSIAALEHSAAA
jgi:HPt (histidine-containing phosphotransfer) domain-containing protein